MYLDLVGKDTFYGLLASLRGQLFRDADFAELYCLDNGRVSVLPSLLATALLDWSPAQISHPPSAPSLAAAPVSVSAFQADHSGSPYKALWLPTANQYLITGERRVTVQVG